MSIPFRLSLSFSLIFFSCSTENIPDYGEDFLKKRDLANQLINENVRPWLVCDFPAKNGCADDGDSLLWIGLHCLSSEKYCHYVPQSMSENGQLWRSPLRVNVDTLNAFSRDMSLGALAYFLKTRDINTFDRWISFLNSTGGKACLLSSDNRCQITPHLRFLVNLIGNYIGSKSSLDGSRMNLSTYKYSLSMSAYTSPLGYPIHLIAVQAYLLSLMGHRIDDIGKTVANRMPNGFTFFVNKEYEKSVDWVIENMPKQQPQEENQWSFERATENKAWEKSMGYEFDFLVLLLNTK